MSMAGMIGNWFHKFREKRRREKEMDARAYQNQKAKFDLGECVYDTFTGNSDARFRDSDGNVHAWMDFLSQFTKNFKVDEHLTFTLYRFYMGYMDRDIYGKKFKEGYYCEVTYYIDGMPVPWGNDYVALTIKAVAKIRQDAEEYRKRKEAAFGDYMENLEIEQSGNVGNESTSREETRVPEEAECEDASDWDAVRRGRDYSAADIDKFRCIRNFINCAYSNITSAILDILKKRLPNYNELYMGFKHGNEDSEDNHSDTLDQMWYMNILLLDDDGTEYSRKTVWFPCRLFWMKRKDIRVWFENDGKQNIDNVVRWAKSRGSELTQTKDPV